MKKISFKKGFSLIELMVVIAIIALLTAIVTSNLTQSKAKARDGKRVSDLAQIQLALELFFDRCNAYPPGLDTASGKNSSNPALEVASCPAGITLGSFITTIPKDNGVNYTYGVNNQTNSLDYVLRAQLETKSTALQDDIDNDLDWYVYNFAGGFDNIDIGCDDPLNAPFNYCVSPK